MSRPARGAWVEIVLVSVDVDGAGGRAPQGARGLKYHLFGDGELNAGRAPQGARGLKWQRPLPCGRKRQSRPARGAWVEICRSRRPPRRRATVAPRKGRVG